MGWHGNRLVFVLTLAAITTLQIVWLAWARGSLWTNEAWPYIQYTNHSFQLVAGGAAQAATCPRAVMVVSVYQLLATAVLAALTAFQLLIVSRGTLTVEWIHWRKYGFQGPKGGFVNPHDQGCVQNWESVL